MRSLLWHLSILYFFLFLSCNHQRPSNASNSLNEKPAALVQSANDTFIQPKITILTPGNQPKVIPVGKPVIRMVTPDEGTPFFTNYGTDQGLPFSAVLSSAVDKIGNLWFGTGGGGVYRYDGKSFTGFTNVNGLAGNVVFSIIPDKDGVLWFGTTAGVSKYDGKKFTNYTTTEGTAGNFITCIFQDSGNNIWFGTHEGGISKYNGKTFTNYTMVQGLADNYVHCIIQDKNENLWFGTGLGLSEYDGKIFINYTTKQGLPDNNINSLLQDNAGNLWVGTNNGISKYDLESFTNYTTTQGVANNKISCITQDKSGNIWFGTNTGVSKYDGKRFTSYTKEDGLADVDITSFLHDKAGRMWFTTQGGGISRDNGDNITHYTVKQGLPDNLIFSALQDKAGNLWFGSYNGGVSKYDGKSFSNYTTTQGLADLRIWNMLQDKSGNLWFGTDKAGAIKYDGKTFTDYTSIQGLPDNTVYSLMQDKNGNIWFGTNEGAAKYDGKSFTSYTKAQGLAGNKIESIIQDKSGNIWFATHDNGVCKYDGHGFTNYTTKEGLPANTVYCITEDQHENLWLATNKGACKYDGKNFTNYTTAQGLPDNNIWEIAEDKNRNVLWFGTNTGLAAMREQVMPDINKADDFEIFNTNTGYPITDVSTGALLIDNKGIIWAGSGHKELIRFDYSKVSRNYEALNLAILDVKVNNESICWSNLVSKNHNERGDSLTLLNEMITSFGKVLAPDILDSIGKKYKDLRFDSIERFYPVPVNLILPYEDNNLTIDFVAIEPALQGQVKYQYKLEGYNDNWSPLTNNSTAVFGNIPQGIYTFKLKALSPSGMWSQTAYTFKVLPPWWNTWWAYASYILGGAVILYTLYRSRIRSIENKQAAAIQIMLKAQEEERKRISRDLHDDIGARLTNINMLSALGQQKMTDAEAMSEYLKRVSTEVQTSAEALDDIVWSIDSRNDSIEDLITRMRRYTADVFEGTSIRYIFTAGDNFSSVKLPAGMRSDFFLVFKESITNIQKHAGATMVKINIEATLNNLVMKVNDNGKGFDSKKQTQRNGLKNMEQRMQKWRGTFTVDSLQGKGATLKMDLPLSGPSLKRGIWQWFKNW